MGRKLVVNGAFYGLALIVAIVGMFLASGEKAELVGTVLLLNGFGLFLTGGFQFARILREEDILKFWRVVFVILGILGILILAFTTLINGITFSSSELTFAQKMADPYKCQEYVVFLVGFAILSAHIFNVVFMDMEEIFPSLISRYPTEFFWGYGYPIFFAVMLALSLGLGLSMEFLFIALLIINVVVVTVFVMLHSHDHKVWSYIVLGVCLLANIIFAITYATGEPEISGYYQNIDLITDGLQFNFATILFPFLTAVLLVPFHAIAEKTGRFSETFQNAVCMIFPLICFGLQFLMFYYWYFALIGAAIVFGVTLLIGFFS